MDVFSKSNMLKKQLRTAGMYIVFLYVIRRELICDFNHVDFFVTALR